MKQPIDDGGCPEVIIEIFTPGLPWDVARNDRGTVIVVTGQQHFLHEAGAAGFFSFDLLESDLVNYEQFSADIRLDGLHQRAVGETGVESGKHGSARGIEHAAVCSASAERESQRDMALSRAGHAGEQNVLALLDEAQRRKLEDEVAIEAGLEREVERLERLACR